MGAWAYCRKCDAGFDKPSVYEVVEGNRTCHQCGERNPVNVTKDEFIIEMAEDINNLKLAVESLSEQISHLNTNPNA